MRDQGGERTYGIWGFVALFSVLTLVGVIMLLVSGSSDRGTTQVPTPQTLPPTTDTTIPSTTTTSTSVPATTPDPAAADLPDGVTQVLSEAGTTSYVFAAPEGTDRTSLQAAVAPLGVRIADDGRTATLTVGCVRSSEEFLAQVLVTEGDRSITFAAIAVSAPDAPPCPSTEDPRTLEVTLSQPLGGRSVVVVPAGTEVPALQPA